MPTSPETELRPHQVSHYDERYRNAFAALNSEWIRKYFTLEHHDLEQLSRPQEFILDPGGEIFFVLEADQVVGTCAMISIGTPENRAYELAKMAVAPAHQGRGYGDVLIKTAIAWAQAKGAAHVMLLSNTLLKPAIALYKKHGFEVDCLGPHPDYERCNIKMTLRFR